MCFTQCFNEEVKSLQTFCKPIVWCCQTFRAEVEASSMREQHATLQYELQTMKDTTDGLSEESNRLKQQNEILMRELQKENKRYVHNFID